MNKDKFNLKRFLDAQRKDYAVALSEIKNGRKQSHWMWYIFPQVYGLGYTSTSMEYGIRSLDEATAYLQHEVLGERLIEISNALLALETNDARKVMGNPDDMKLKSSMTLFSLVPHTYPVFQKVLDKYYSGKKDDRTLQFLNM